MWVSCNNKNVYHALLSYLIACVFPFFSINAESLRESKGLETTSFITTNLLSPLNPFHPRLRFGYIHSLDLKWKIGLDLGYGRGIHIHPSDGNEEDYQLWEVRPQLYYELKSKSRSVRYISFELFYIHNTETLRDSFFRST